ncbi:MAG: hypothetical protein AB7F31_02045 [Parachlamydiales bacterium]
MSRVVAALLFLVLPLMGLSYWFWSLPGLFFGGGMGLVGLALLLLVDWGEPAGQPVGGEVAVLQAALREEREMHAGYESLLREREEGLVRWEEHAHHYEALAEERGREVEHLKGEIRRLLHLEPEADSGPPLAADPEGERWAQTLPHSSRLEVTGQYDAHTLLVQCLERAQNLPGVRALAGRSKRFEELSMGDYAIDLRPLFDAFRGERGAAIALYSPREERLLFASNLIRGLLGWAPERFVRDFNWLVRTGVDEWRQWVAALDLGETGHLEMIFRSASDEEVPVGCALGRIPTGAFQGLIVAILYRLPHTPPG